MRVDRRSDVLGAGLCICWAMGGAQIRLVVPKCRELAGGDEPGPLCVSMGWLGKNGNPGKVPASPWG